MNAGSTINIGASNTGPIGGRTASGGFSSSSKEESKQNKSLVNDTNSIDDDQNSQSTK